MFLARRPEPAFLDRLLAQARAMPLSYEPVGLAKIAAPAGYRVADERGVIGHGGDAFSRAVRALQRWEQFDLGWAAAYPDDAALVPGSDVLIIASHVGFWSVNACRIVYTLGSAPELGIDSPRRNGSTAQRQSHNRSTVAGLGTTLADEPRHVAGFAYGTLTEHAEAGEEIFQLTFDESSGEVEYLIRAVSKESLFLAKLGFPVARALQARFRRDSIVRMRRAVAESAR